MAVRGRPLGPKDRALVRAAERTLRRGYDRDRHTVAAAVRTRSGAVYVGLNLNGIHTPCAEPVALGAAVTHGDRDVELMVAVYKDGARYGVLSPCGTCRQLLLDYAPHGSVIVRFPSGRVARLSADESLPAAYRTFEDE
jgi:cytidine deaminase